MGQIRNVVVVGAGTMGSQIALQAAFSGRYEVFLVDTAPGQLDRARKQNDGLVARAIEKGRMSAEEGAKALERITTSEDLAVTAAGADLVIEAVVEDFEAKEAVFTALGDDAPVDTIIASNSSTIAISRLAGFTGHPERCCNMHFFHPVTVMQLCEVVRGPQTSDQTVAAAVEFVRSSSGASGPSPWRWRSFIAP